MPSVARPAVPIAPVVSPWLDVAQAAAYLSVSTSLVRKRVADGTIPFSRLGGRVLLHRDRLDEWVADGTAA